MGSGVYAVADLGSNTVHLLVAAVEAGHVRALADESAMVRIGDDVDRFGSISATKIDHVIATLRDFRHHAECLGAETLTLMATQTVGRAINRADLFTRIALELHASVRVLTAVDQARLVFDGVVLSTRHYPGLECGDQPYLIIDAGGGSTQLVLGRQREMVAWHSLPIGSGRLTTRFAASDPPTSAEFAAIEAAVDEAIAQIPPDFGREPAPIAAYGVGGSAKAVRRIANQPKTGSPIECEQLARSLSDLKQEKAMRVAHAYKIDVERARVLPAGIIILRRVLQHFGVPEIRIRLASIRDGAVLHLATRGGL